MRSVNIQLFGGRGARSKLGVGGKGFAENPSRNSNTKEIECNRFSTLKEWEANIRGLKYEVLVVFKNGNPIKAYCGEEAAVDPPEHEYSRWQGCVVTHNHPNNGTFSIYDLERFGTYDYKEIRAVVNDGVFIFRSTPESDYNGFLSDINVKYPKLKKKIELNVAAETKMFERGKLKMSIDIFNKHLLNIQLSMHNKFYKKIADGNGFIYKKIK